MGSTEGVCVCVCRFGIYKFYKLSRIQFTLHKDLQLKSFAKEVGEEAEADECLNTDRKD